MYLKYDFNYQKFVLKSKNDIWRIKMHNLAKIFVKGKILELGCGVNPTFKNSIKIDIVPLNLKNFIVADLNKKFPLKDNFFDSIVSFDVIEHLYDIDNFLSEVNRVLKKDGIFIISTPNVLSLKNRIKFIFGNNFIFSEYKTTGHIVFFDVSSLKNKLEEFNFKKIKIIPMGKIKIKSFCGVFLAICYKI